MFAKLVWSNPNKSVLTVSCSTMTAPGRRGPSDTPFKRHFLCRLRRAKGV